MGDWKLYRTVDKKGRKIAKLFNLKDDIAESKDLSKSNPEMLEQLINKTSEARTPSKYFRYGWDEDNK